MIKAHITSVRNNRNQFHQEKLGIFFSFSKKPISKEEVLCLSGKTDLSGDIKEIKPTDKITLIKSKWLAPRSSFTE